MKNDLIIGAVLGISLILVGGLFLQLANPTPPNEVNDFVSCAEAPGSVIMESYPEQCRTSDGKTFENEEQRDDLNQDTLATSCQAEGGKWLDEHRECEGVSNTWCSQNGGQFNECASACRHSPPGTACILLCVPVCEFQPTDPTPTL